MDVFTTWSELDAAPPGVGDPVTVCDYPELFFVHVGRTVAHGFVSEKTRVVRVVVGCVASEEGKRWIRGHHTAESEEGAALLAAQALLR